MNIHKKREDGSIDSILSIIRFEDGAIADTDLLTMAV